MDQNNQELVFKGMRRLRYRQDGALLQDAARSPYYWWWAYLRLSKDYWWVCQRNGIADDLRLRAMYSDFGKVYEITTPDPITQKQMDHLLKGVVLDDDPKPCFATACKQLSENTLAMTIVEGRYHQVKRTMAAVGNHVAKLHRTEIGQYVMPVDLAEGEWRWLYPEDLQKLSKSVEASIV